MEIKDLDLTNSTDWHIYHTKEKTPLPWWSMALGESGETASQWVNKFREKNKFYWPPSQYHPYALKSPGQELSITGYFCIYRPGNPEWGEYSL